MSQYQFDPAKRIYGVLLACVTALFWGFLAIALKVVVAEIHPVTIVWFRMFLAFSSLFIYFIIFKPSALRLFLRPPLYLLVAGAGLSLNFLGFNHGIALTTPGIAQIFIQLGPILLALAGIALFGEKLSLRQFLGFVTAAAGFSLFYQTQLSGFKAGEEVYIKGVIWLVIAALAWLLFAIMQKPLLKKHQAQELNLVIYAMATILYTPFADYSSFASFNLNTWLLLLFLGINTLVAYGCLVESFKYIEANKVSIIITLNPVITFIAMAAFEYYHVTWIDPEIFSPLTFLGAALVLGGAIMVVLPKKGLKKHL
ncbi:MAG: DMT family transporter [Cyclobacteriaceae bacterium]|nr:DMT family transporter [Cyclobacteriaceae bacterium]